MNRGLFPAVLDEDLGVALLMGPMMYRHIFGSSESPDWLAEGAVDSFWKAHARPIRKNRNANARKSRLQR
jgi:hypothetical protein